MEALQLAGRSILVVEDQPLIAFDLQEILEGAGACVVCAARLETGLEMADLPGLSVAIVDFGLGTSNGAEICNKLCARGVPFLFHSGRPGSAFVRWPEAPVVGKPAFCDALLAAVADLLRSSRMAPDDPDLQAGPEEHGSGQRADHQTRRERSAHSPGRRHMPVHQFKVGELLQFNGLSRGTPWALQCKVVGVLPMKNGQLRYRIKCTSERCERVAPEGDLFRLS